MFDQPLPPQLRGLLRQLDAGRIDSHDVVHRIWDILYATWSRDVFLFLRTRLGEDALDAFQWTFLKAFQALRQGALRVAPEKRNFAAWLRRIAENEARRVWRRGRAEGSAGMQAVPYDGREPKDPTPGPELGVQRQDLRERLSHCLELLPPRQRQIVQRRLIDDLSGPAVAEELAMKAGAVRVALHRARDSLRRCLEESGPYDSKGGTAP